MEIVIERLRKFINDHPEMRDNGFIQGLTPDGKVVINLNGEKKRITIDELENGQYNKTEEVVSPKEEIEVMEEISDEPIEQIETMPTSREISTLKDVSDAIDAKDEVAVNKVLETFALDKAGNININKAISVVTDNSTNNVIACVRDNTILSNDLSKYDVVGKTIEPFVSSSEKVSIDQLIDNSFNNILVYTKAASTFKNQVYNDNQIQAAKQRYSSNINDKLKVLGLDKKEEKVVEPQEKKQEKEMKLELKPDTDIRKAGFADIVILTVIVLIYAAIIINLISKLK